MAITTEVSQLLAQKPGVFFVEDPPGSGLVSAPHPSWVEEPLGSGLYDWQET